MPDRVEREIEEILAKLDNEKGGLGNERKPVSILSARTKKAQQRPPRIRRRAPSISPATLMFTGAGIVIGGLVLSSIWSPLIWASFAGVVIFLGAFVLSFFRSSSPGGAQPRGHYWRDRYIEYNAPARSGPIDRLRRKFRRR